MTSSPPNRRLLGVSIGLAQVGSVHGRQTKKIEEEEEGWGVRVRGEWTGQLDRVQRVSLLLCHYCVAHVGMQRRGEFIE